MDIVNYWHVAILFVAWTMVALTLTAVVMWSGTKLDVDPEEQAIKDHFAEEHQEESKKHIKIVPPQ